MTLALMEREAAQELRRRLSTEVPIHELVVFGSCARGEATTESDLDVLVVLDDLTPTLRRRISEIAWEVGFERGQFITTIVATRRQLEGALGSSPLMRNIRLEGIPV